MERLRVDNPMKLTIYMGSRCNLNCPYCHREATEESPISEEFLNLIRRRSDLLIKFMGGEPTLYMDEIRKVVEAAPNAVYAISTNGINLSKHLPFFREHRFQIAVSYDGTDIRGFDPFTDLIDYPWLCVSCTLYHGNTNFKAIMRKFEEKERIVGRTIGFFPHVMHCTGEHNKALALTADDFDFILQQYKECVDHYIDDYLHGVINIRLRSIFDGLVRHLVAGYSFGETYCVNRGLQKLDSTGKQFSCLYIRDDDLSGDWQAKQAEIIHSKFQRCESCPVYDMCGAACIKSAEHELECSFYFKLFSWFRERFNEVFLCVSE